LRNANKINDLWTDSTTIIAVCSWGFGGQSVVEWATQEQSALHKALHLSRRHTAWNLVLSRHPKFAHCPLRADCVEKVLFR
jgi:hypothetical protein